MVSFALLFSRRSERTVFGWLRYGSNATTHVEGKSALSQPLNYPSWSQPKHCNIVYNAGWLRYGSNATTHVEGKSALSQPLNYPSWSQQKHCKFFSTLTEYDQALADEFCKGGRKDELMTYSVFFPYVDAKHALRGKNRYLSSLEYMKFYNGAMTSVEKQSLLDIFQNNWVFVVKSHDDWLKEAENGRPKYGPIPAIKVDEGCTKVKIDACYNRTTHVGSLGVVYEDSSGGLLNFLSQTIVGKIASSEEAELCALEEAVRVAIQEGLTNLVIVCDNMSVVCGMDPSELGKKSQMNFFSRYEKLRADLREKHIPWRIVHVYRECNLAADYCAKAAFRGTSCHKETVEELMLQENQKRHYLFHQKKLIKTTENEKEVFVPAN